MTKRNGTDRRKLHAIAERARKLPHSRQAALLDELAEREHQDTADETAMFDWNKRAFVTLAEISEAYALCVRTLLRHIEAGELEALKLGRSYRVTRRQLAAWLDRRRSRAARA